MKKRFLRWGLMALSMLWLVANAQTINSAEYFYDTDPGLGNGTPVAPFTPADSVNLNLTLPTTGLGSGLHYAFVRFRYNNGSWGLQEGRPFFTFPANANTAKINRAEYFYDTDPGLGNGTAITVPTPTDSANLNLNLPTTGLNTGLHHLFVRFRYDNGTWGLYEGASFYVIQYAQANAAKINRAEYFYDTDPGLGNGTAIPVSPATDSANVSVSIPTTGLPAGPHYLFVRFRYDDGTWGLHEGRSLYILSDIGLANTAKIDRAEYFFDTDPGLGNGTAIAVSPATDSANLSVAIPTTGLPEGPHHLFVRFRYDNGTWGLHEGRSLYILSDIGLANTAKINRAEYFFDTDPGFGNGTAITVPAAADSVNLTLTPSTTGLNSGYHQLFIRFGYDNGTWGLYEGRPFYVLPVAVANTAKIDMAEYFFDNDPGVGRGTAVAISPGVDTANIVVSNVNITGLSAGSHNLFFRFRYDNGTWGLYEGRTFNARACTPPPAAITASGDTTYCLGGSVTLTSNTGSTLSYQWQRNGVDIQGATTNVYTVTDTTGSYAIVITDTGSCYAVSNAIAVYVGREAGTPVAASICSNDSYDFNGDILTTAGEYRDTLSTFAGCDSIIVLTLTVNQVPTVTLAGNPDTLCSDATAITLSGGAPSGGVYSGTGVSSGSFNPAVAGIGAHVITYTANNAGCADSATETIVVKVCETIGIDETTLESQVRLYPNPVEDELIVESALLTDKSMIIAMFDVSGRQVTLNYKQQGAKFVFQAGKLPAGVYSLRFNINGEIVNKRFIKSE